MMVADLTSYLLAAFEARSDLLADLSNSPRQALRLFNGFYEGWPSLAVDLYASSLVLHNYADPPEEALADLATAQVFYLNKLPWLQTVVVKPRKSPSAEIRPGYLAYGAQPARRVQEEKVWYALDLLLNRDASLYLDTRLLRKWAFENLAGKRVLNTFAYTGSLGVAARVGGALEVLHLDLNRKFLNLAKDSYMLNGLPVSRSDFLAGDFWTQVNTLKRAGRRFDCVFLDPPFYSSTHYGVVDLQRGYQQVINKVRPLVDDGGWLVVINNALFLSGADYMQTVLELAQDGYLSLESIIPVPTDFTGYPHTRHLAAPTDPTPFNHATKIAILKVKRKQTQKGI